jgi:primary-amine oxidase
MRTPFRVLTFLIVSLLGLTAARALQEAPPPTPETGTLVEWKGWRFRWAVRLREGLMLNDVSFQGRSVLKSAALAEIFVPYHPGQPRPEDSLDGMGRSLFPLLPSRDCLPGTECRMFDANGRPSAKPVVAMHEEATGPLYIGEQGRAYGSMLVLWCAPKLGDYTYYVRWRFRDDGMLMPQVGLTGKLSHTGAGGASPHGSLVHVDEKGGRRFAPSHVHNFYYRLDFDIDGRENTVEEFNHVQDQPGRSLSSRDGWTPIRTESARALNGPAFRTWRVVNHASRNRLGLPRSYELIPGGNGVFRGGANEPFAQADLWVVRHKPHEFPLSSADPRPVRQALPSYVNGEPVEDTDVAVWYSMHVHHFPRTEDWPAMPVEWAGFTLMPRDFLDGSPLQPR